jgi:signal transduction histidine kinase
MDGARHHDGSRQSVSATVTQAASSRRDWAELADAAEGLVHAIRNPLFALRLDLHTLRRCVDKAKVEAGPSELDAGGILKNCERQIDMAERFLSELTLYACPPPADVEILELADELRTAVDQFNGRQPRVELPDSEATRRSVLVLMDADRLQTILSSMLELGLSAPFPEMTSVKLRARKGLALLSVSNPQWTLSERESQRLFKPFASLDNWTPTARLAAARRFAVESGGRLTCVSGTEKGTTLRLRLPLWSESGSSNSLK